MPNNNFKVQREWLKESLGIQRLHLVNDCVAAALAVDTLNGKDVAKICGGDEDVQSLGTAGIMPHEHGKSVILPCEGGHSELPLTTDREFAVAELMRKKHGFLSREDAISFDGLRSIFLSVSRLNKVPEIAGDGLAIIGLARDGNREARESVSLLTGWLAATASDIALMIGARGGIYLCGALVDQIALATQGATFSDRFTSKGRLSDYLQEIPVLTLGVPQLEIRGLTTLFC